MTDEMRKNMDEAKAQLAQVEEDRAERERKRNTLEEGTMIVGDDVAAHDNLVNASANASDKTSREHLEQRARRFASDRNAAEGAQYQIGTLKSRRDSGDWTSSTNLSDANIESRDYKSKRDELRERYKNAKTDAERNAIRMEGNEFLKKDPRNQDIRAVIDAQYQKSYEAINARVQRGEISPFEAKALHDDLRAKREAKIKRETGVDLAFERAQKQQQEDESRMNAMKDRMGQTTYTLFKAMDRTRDPSLSNEERAAAMQVAGEAATQMGQDFLENKFGPNSGYKSQVQVINDENPATGMKEVAYRVTFTDANGNPVADPRTGKPMEIKFDTARVKTALKDHYGFQDIADDDGEGGAFASVDEEGNVSNKFASIETGEGLYGGKRSLKTQDTLDAKARAEKADRRSDIAWDQSQEDRAERNRRAAIDESRSNTAWEQSQADRIARQQKESEAEQARKDKEKAAKRNKEVAGKLMTGNYADENERLKLEDELAQNDYEAYEKVARFNNYMDDLEEKEEFKRLAKEEQDKYRANLKEYFTTDDPKRKRELLGEIGAADPEMGDRLYNSEIRAARAAGGGGGESAFLPQQDADAQAANNMSIGGGALAKPFSTKPGAAG